MAYEMTDSKERLTQRYVEVSLDLERVVREVGLSGAIYTQTTDVENEVNGYMTYDRQIMKLDLPGWRGEIARSSLRGHASERLLTPKFC